MSSSRKLLRTAPAIRISRASPDTGEEKEGRNRDEYHHSRPKQSTPRRAKSLPSRAQNRPAATQLDIKRSATTAESSGRTKNINMPSSTSSSRDSPSSPRGQYRSGASTKKARIGSHDVDWTEITDPEERRRIQNRIAQRKFREKARDNKERSERDSRNLEHAGNSYRVPVASDIDTTSELSGLPWGSMNLNHVVFRGHDAESRRSGSGQGTTYLVDEGYPYSSAYRQGFAQAASYGSSGAGDESFYEQATYTYDATGLQAYTPR